MHSSTAQPDHVETGSSWYAGAGLELVSQLKARRAQINAMRLRLFSLTMERVRPQCLSARAFLDLTQDWSRADATIRQHHLASPAFDHWVYLADCCRRRLENDEAVSWDDLPAYRAFDTPGTEPIEWLLRDFGRFALDLAVEAKVSCSGVALVWDGSVFLSHTGLWLSTKCTGRVDWQLTYGPDGTQLEIGTETYGWLGRSPADDLRIVSGVHSAPRIERAEIGQILICGEDPLVRREWVQAYVNPDGSTYLPAPADLSEFRNHYDAGLRLIETYVPSLGRDIAFGLHTIIPVGKPAIDRGVSCTSDTFWGAILTCDNPPVLAAEVLIHEFGHNIFNEMLARDRVFKSTFSADEVLYSPWREDPRPVLGLFHATFVFTRVSEFYARHTADHPADDDAQYRFRLLLACTRIACRSLAASDSYEPFGRALVTNLTERTDALSRLPHAVLQGAEQAAIRAHFQAWCARNPALAERNHFEIPS